jgi:2-aminoadipate transaminase
VPVLTRALRAKLETLMEALNEQFGTAAEFEDPKGGIFLWVKLPDQVDTQRLFAPALAAGVAINPGAEWSTDKIMAEAACGCVSPIPRMRRFAPAWRRWPTFVGANSASRRGSPMWRSEVR